MQLLNSLYTITSAESDAADRASFALHLDAGHFIYAAHFPGNPITPGVVQLGIVEELASRHLGSTLKLAHINNIKYMNIISPAADADISADLSRIRRNDDATVSLQAVLRSTSATFTKMSITLTPAQHP